MGPYERGFWVPELITSKWYAWEKKFVDSFLPARSSKIQVDFLFYFLVILLICLFYKSVSERFRALRIDTNVKNVFSQIITISFLFLCFKSQ